MIKPVKWATAITTVPERKDLFLRTLTSLRRAGFEEPPHIFVDGDPHREWWLQYSPFVALRWPRIRTYGNWILSLAELYIRNPDRHLYAIFQDDFVTYRNLKTYLERCKFPEKGYWNLYTFPMNQELCPPGHTGWYLSNQRGKGAVALIFSREGVQTLLAQQTMINKPTDPHRGWRTVDGAVVTGYIQVGWREYVHNPSLVQHTGDISSMENKPHKKAVSFKGEEFDAMELVNGRSRPTADNY